MEVLKAIFTTVGAASSAVLLLILCGSVAWISIRAAAALARSFRRHGGEHPAR